jgi:hypothetical protein|tara:strand:- start:1501 stop:1713 length:213 start_codon:yes stop_codon:yes gene_type:complete
MYVQDFRGPVSETELDELWERRQKLHGIKFVTGAVSRSRLPLDEQHLTLNEREKKLVAEAKAQGRNIEKV